MRRYSAALSLAAALAITPSAWHAGTVFSDGFDTAASASNYNVYIFRQAPRPVR